MNDITILIPIHVWGEDVKAELLKAVSSVEKAQEEYKNGELIIEYVISSKLKKEVNLPTTNLKNSTVWNDGETDFCSQVNLGVDNVKTDFFSILEFDDEYLPKWFKHFSDYYYGNEEISAFLPINIVHTNRKNYMFGNEFGLSNAFITEKAEDTDDIGIINFDRLENCSVFNLTGAVISTQDFIKAGKYKPSIKVSFNYEMLLRMTKKGMKCMVVPKEGYLHNLGREGSLTYVYNKELTDEEIQKWFELAFNECIYDEDRKKTIIKDETIVLK